MLGITLSPGLLLLYRLLVLGYAINIVYYAIHVVHHVSAPTHLPGVSCPADDYVNAMPEVPVHHAVENKVEREIRGLHGVEKCNQGRDHVNPLLVDRVR